MSGQPKMIRVLIAFFNLYKFFRWLAFFPFSAHSVGAIDLSGDVINKTTESTHIVQGTCF